MTYLTAASKPTLVRGQLDHDKKAVAKPEYRFLVISLLIYLWGSELYNFFPISPNVISGILVVCALFAIYLMNLSHGRVLIIAACGLMVLYTIAKAEDIVENFNSSLRIVTLLMVFWLIADQNGLSHLGTALDSYPRIMAISVFALNALTLVELAMPSCYVSGFEKGGWGDGSFFVGFTNWPHTVASNTIFLLSLNIIRLLNTDFKSIELLYIAVPTLAVLQSGARVYLVPLCVLIVFYYIFKLKANNIKSRWLTFVVLILGLCFAFMNTGMLDKFAATTEGISVGGDDFLSAFTNSRTTMWDNLRAIFIEGNLLEKIFGYAFDYAEARMKVGAHNDVLYMLVSTGVTGCVLYCLTILGALRGLWRSLCKVSKGGCIIFSLVTIYVLFPILMNGLYNNPHLVFSNAIVFLIVFKGLSDEENPQKARMGIDSVVWSTDVK